MEGIKLTNFTESKEIHNFLERQFPKEFNMIINSKSIKYRDLINLVLNIFKDYASFRIYFTGYTNEEKELIAFFLTNIGISEPNKIRRKIAGSLSSEQLQNFCDGVFQIKLVDENDDVRLIGDWVVTLMEVNTSEQTTEFALTTDNDEEFSIYFQNGKFSHSYDIYGENSSIDEETFPLLITECEKWSRELLGDVSYYQENEDFEPTYPVNSFKTIRIPYKPKDDIFRRLINKWKGTGWNFFGRLLLKKSDWDLAKEGLLSIKDQNFNEIGSLKTRIHWYCIRNGKKIILYDEYLNTKNNNTVEIRVLEDDRDTRNVFWEDKEKIVEEIDTRKELKIPGIWFKKSIPSNVLDWCKNGNGYHVFEEVQQLTSWYNSLTGKNFVGGTSIGRSPQTLILDITYQGSEVYIDSGSIKVCGEIVESRKDLKIILEKNFKYV